jgi:outer membrane lipoprotein carrier protein
MWLWTSLKTRARAGCRTAVLGFLLGAGLLPVAHADATEALRAFVRDVKSGRAEFTQTVASPDGLRKKVSSGRFAFSRPNRFRFDYLKPYLQTIVGDGQKVWFHDPDLNQVTVRKLGDALGSTPAALLAGQAIDRDFELKTLPDRDGLQWVQAWPRNKEGTIQWLQLGFRGKTLASLEIADSFGQRSVLKFDSFQIEPSLPAELFRFVMPAGADLAEPAL